ncbi:hypothetical protein C8R44DRAFT_896117 [Mycena epipterygia]|nr:hypothetical protein C8R44DRAFT_896117 [Mycena epipterygia]
MTTSAQPHPVALLASSGMDSKISARLSASGAGTIFTNLEGHSDPARQRAKKAGMQHRTPRSSSAQLNLDSVKWMAHLFNGTGVKFIERCRRNELTLAVLRGFQGNRRRCDNPRVPRDPSTSHFPPASRARAFAFASFAASVPVGGALRMVLGGLVTQLTRRVPLSLTLLQRFVACIVIIALVWADTPQFFLFAALAFTALLAGMCCHGRRR